MIYRTIEDLEVILTSYYDSRHQGFKD